MKPVKVCKLIGAAVTATAGFVFGAPVILTAQALGTISGLAYGLCDCTGHL